MQRFSRKRESILECLKSTKTHPTAEWVYERVKTEYPEISLATVYRNLRQMADEGVIRRVGPVNGQERFDATATPHVHLTCSRCGRVFDADSFELPASVGESLLALTGFAATDASFTGLCRACREEEQS